MLKKPAACRCGNAFQIEHTFHQPDRGNRYDQAGAGGQYQLAVIPCAPSQIRERQENGDYRQLSDFNAEIEADEGQE